MDNKQRVKTFLQGLLADYGAETEFDDNTLLVSSGILDSQAVLRMVVFLEETFGIDLAERGFDQDDFDSLTNIMRLITP
ncbi:MAG: hypothetical protein PHI06_08315 [Desulfobulbaceae bacterium]|nr:hypothetical protein [Desulfobulbaceae bacterium]